MIDPLKPEDLHGTGHAQQRPGGDFRQALDQFLKHTRSIISAIIARRSLPVARQDNSDAQFMRESPEYEPGFAMQDMFDLSLTWDDLKFLHSNHILPLAAIEQADPNNKLVRKR